MGRIPSRHRRSPSPNNPPFNPQRAAPSTGVRPWSSWFYARPWPLASSTTFRTSTFAAQYPKKISVITLPSISIFSTRATPSAAPQYLLSLLGAQVTHQSTVDLLVISMPLNHEHGYLQASLVLPASELSPLSTNPAHPTLPVQETPAITGPQLVVEAGSKNSILISTIVLTDGVERVGKTGVAIELSDKGARTGIIYMIQLRSEQSAGGLFDSLLEGSDRAAAH
ncbi:Breakpoint cluster region protein [Mycena sanguinolenta]|uniref:Breakpoint cluster region protein n=1 Tax=Mycena sanguinolenta TaxID=230812 RepID=A0A8H6XE28_9AGAR|nr:Breakpoint cluster region protein [Mycena sanguinolenta]